MDLDGPEDFIGKPALLKIKAAGIRRRLSGFVIQGDPVLASEHRVPLLQNEIVVGSISEMAYSSRLKKNIGIGLISNTIADDVDNLKVSLASGLRSVTINDLPFIRQAHR